MSVENGPCDDTEQAHITVALGKIIENRTVIDQAKGMLMAIYGIDADHAFVLLRWYSQQHNLKVRVVAEQIAKDFVQEARNKPPANRATYDNLLLDVHQQIANSAESA